MTVATHLRQTAAEIADNIEAETAQLREKLENAKAVVVGLEAQLHATHVRYKRLANFQPEVGGQFQCPVCWMDDESRSPLVPQPSRSRDDIFRCGACGYETVIPA